MIINVPLDIIHANPWQTRGQVDPESIKSLALDIAANGLLQAPMGRLIGKGGGAAANFDVNEIDPKLWGDGPGDWDVQIAFGHSRLAAFRWLNDVKENSDLTGDWSKIPIDVRLISDVQMAITAWSENEKRRDLNPIERGHAIERVIGSFGWTHEEAAARLGISRPVVSNALRLLKLPETVQEYLRTGKISERVGLALAPMYDVDEEAAREVEFGFTTQAIIGWALEGYSSEKIRERVNEALDWMKKQQQPELIVEVESGAAPAQQSSPEIKAAAEIQPIEQPAVADEEHPSEQAPEPAPSASSPTGSAQSAATASSSAPSPEQPAAENQPVEKLTWEQSTLTLSITLNPEDGHPAGRLAILGLRANNGFPIVQMSRERDVFPQMSGILNELFEKAMWAVEA